MTNWKNQKFGKLIHVKHGYGFKSQYFKDEGSHILLTPGNFFDEGGFKETSKPKYYEGPVPEGFVLSQGDLIVAMTEQAEGLLGSAALVPESNKYLHNQRLGLVFIKDETQLDKQYLYFLFNTSLIRKQIRASSNGAKVRHTSPDRIYRCVTVFPPLPTQKKIAAILSAYDDLIENNTQRIALLEKAAEEIYREWFVRMRFPGWEQTKFVKGVPEGWEVKPLSSISKEVRKGVKIKDVPPNTTYLGLEHLPRKSLIIKDHTTADTVQSDKLLFAERDILFGKIRPYLHKVAIPHFAGVCSSDTIVIRPKKICYEGFLFFTVFSDTFVELATISSKGTKMPRADWDFLKTLEIIIPSSSILEAFQEQFEAHFKMMINLSKANDHLKKSRDLLLPRLISGKLPVDDLDIHFPPRMIETE